VPGLPKGLTIPPLKNFQVELLSTPVDKLPPAAMFTSVPLVARLTSGVDEVKALILRQRELVTEEAASSNGERKPEARVKKVDNKGNISLGFTVRLDVPEVTYDTDSDEKSKNSTTRLLEETAEDSKDDHKNLISVFAVKEEGDDADAANAIMDGWELKKIGPKGIELNL
jgi:hypothetical protein